MAPPTGQTALDLDGGIAQAIAAEIVALVREELGLRPAAEDWTDAQDIARLQCRTDAIADRLPSIGPQDRQGQPKRLCSREQPRL